MTTPRSIRHLKIAVILVVSVLVLSTVGYMILEQLSFVDALFTTVAMMATIGDLVHPLSPAGRVLTIGVTIFGVGSLLYIFGAGMEFMIEGHLSQALRRHFMENKIAALRNHYIVCGYGRVGLRIAEEFTRAHLPFVVIDEQEQNVRACIERGYLALEGDATHDSVLLRAGIQHARGLMVATNDDANNIYITLSARNLSSGIFIVARCNDDEAEPKLKLAGADHVLSPYAIVGQRMANLALHPDQSMHTHHAPPQSQDGP